jgi:hypothetical protein
MAVDDLEKRRFVHMHEGLILGAQCSGLNALYY